MLKNIKIGFLPAWIVLLLSISFTIFLWFNARSEINRNARADFDFRVEEIKQALAHRMRGYEQVLRGGAGLFLISDEVDARQWKKYVNNLKIEKNYPGIQGIGFAAILKPAEKEAHTNMMRARGRASYSLWPPGQREVHTSIIYLEPLDWRNQRAIGYDMYSEPVRRAAMDKAVEKDMAAISGKVRLVQETEKDVQAGFLMYVPVYRNGLPASTPVERRAALAGYVYSPFRMNDFMQKIIGRDIPDLDVEVFDGGAVSEGALMYDSDQSTREFRQKGGELFRKTVRMELNGHVWSIHFSTLPAFERQIDSEKPVIVLAAGMAISVLFSAIVFFLASHRTSLRSVNEELSSEVTERKKAEEELRRAHGELESRVVERTRELTGANEALQKEIAVRMQAESALKESTERFRTLVEGTNDWLWEMDADFRYTYVSPMVGRTLGYAASEMLGKTPFEHMEEGEAKRVAEALSRSAAQREPFTIEARCTRKDGTEAVIETSGAPVIENSGKFLGYRGVDRDATERKKLEEERMSLQAQLLQTQKMELMGRLSGGIAHDFNNILSIITSLNNLALKETQSAAVVGYLGQISSASERAANLTRQLLMFSRNQPTKAARLDVNSTIAEVLDLLRNILGENITITSHLAPDLKAVEADKTSMEQLLMNLVVNSKEAMPWGGEITIRSANVIVGGKGSSDPKLAPGEYVSITVSDFGVGMDEDTLRQAFEPFFSTKETGKGVGLGLTVVHDIIKEYKGGIAVESRPGKGSAFRVYLPAMRQEPAAPLLKATGEPAGNGERILLIEDELMLSRSVSLVLTKNGYRVYAARDASEACRIFEREGSGLDLVFSDVVLKGKSGVAVVDEFLAERPGLRVIFASGYMDIDSEWPYIKEKGFSFLQKPYDIPELLRTIRASLDMEPSS